MVSNTDCEAPYYVVSSSVPCSQTPSAYALPLVCVKLSFAPIRHNRQNYSYVYCNYFIC
jgi:hypothetical protein